jgi:uncharacterized repeat protein (TIGR03803 family)
MQSIKLVSAAALVLGATLPSVVSSAATPAALSRLTSGTDGSGPLAALIHEAGYFYGTTWMGGSSGHGTVFKVDQATGVEAVIYSFKGGTDGISPSSGLLSVRGTLFGTTSLGGASGNGTVFKVNPKTGAETVVYSFKGQPDGDQPISGLISQKGVLFGTTIAGGASGNGMVFSLDETTDAERVVYNFKGGSDGAAPEGELISIGGVLFGTTAEGGNLNGSNLNYGTVYRLNPASGIEKAVYRFKSSLDGQNPYGGLIYDGGVFFGTTVYGGSESGGSVFEFNPTTGTEFLIHSFTGPEGANPYGGLVYDSGNLYGTTLSGGAYAGGVLFKVNTTAGTVTVIHSFEGGTDGQNPQAGLIEFGGKLYGTTVGGGSEGCLNGYGCGTVFKSNPPGDAETVIYRFNG